MTVTWADIKNININYFIGTTRLDNFLEKSCCPMGNLTTKFMLPSLKLEQLESLRSEDTPRRLMITHTIESYWIPSQKKTKSKLQI